MMIGHAAIRIADIVRNSIVDGPGIRYVVFVQGCKHKCKGCHNPQTHDLLGGHLVHTKKLMDEMTSDPLISGLTISGGEPFEQAGCCAALARLAKEAGKNVWCYTGYTYEFLNRFRYSQELLNHIDVLVDGPYIEEERSLDLPFRGSRNQRIIDMNATREKGEVVLLKIGEDHEETDIN